MQEFLAYLILYGPALIYLASIFLGLYLHYLVAKKNARTVAATFWDYWLVETPGLSIGTLLTLATAASVVISSGMLQPMTGLNIFIFGFTKAYLFDNVIQAPPAAAAAQPATPGAAT